MKRTPLKKRYDAFCAEAQDLLDRSGLIGGCRAPAITGKGFYEACGALATIHFPEDKAQRGQVPFYIYPRVFCSS